MLDLSNTNKRKPVCGLPGLFMQNPSNKTLGNVEAADHIGVSPKTLATWRCTKAVQIPYVKIGR